MPTEEWQATAIAKINGPTAEQVWPLLADFSNLYKIFPSDISFTIQGSNGQPGQIRYSAGKYPSPTDANAIIVLWAREELMEIDASQKFVTYKIHENNRGLSNFTGTMQVLPDGESGCTFKWSVVSAPVAGSTYEEIVAFQQATLLQMVSMIEKLF
ncbi:hypothetical protein LIER_07855 [Lithospermum erythrorhizon]|uniref:Uncharacterized protein n=1 Tax=Lithospermum erythrorhizon TaxID=34254 RepID=A0AAV3PCH3_LITER